jgi:carboxymethylenebutenolidase
MPQPVKTQWIEIAPGSAGYLALPPAGKGPGLLLFQEIFGVNEHIRAVADQYALDGFVVLAPDVFWRQAPRIELGYGAEDRQRGMALAGAMVGTETLADISAALAALRARPEAAGAKAGAIGYCMGGTFAYLAAATTDIDAAVGYYGGRIHHELDRAKDVRCPLLLHYAERDDHIPPSAVASVREALAGKPVDTHVYAGAMHGFNCWARASYHAPSAALAHGRSLAFLAPLLF